MAYEIYDDRVEVRIIRVGTRENFYEELKRRLKLFLYCIKDSCILATIISRVKYDVEE
ncbi:hypothetical protein [Schinkia azotoformans]|uniref:hypothetical protein n=1 Tax=Schinkia azotoformans TaxID=1454 RepID=UPI00398B565D